MEQQSSEWFEARLGRATASKFSQVLAGGTGITRDKYKAKVVAERLTNKKLEEYSSWQMAQGTEREALARKLYEAITGNTVQEVGFIKIDGLEAGASPDGLVGEDGTVEIKSPELLAHMKILTTKQLPNEYKAQVQGQLWATNRKWCDFVSFNPDMNAKNRIIIIRVERDEVYINMLKTEVTKFMQEVMEAVDKWQ